MKIFNFLSKLAAVLQFTKFDHKNVSPFFETFFVKN